MPDLVKIQHWVPRCYLSAWADNKDKVWMFDRVSQKTAHPGVENIACGRHFYDTEKLKDTESPETLQAVEKLLSKIEGDCSPYLRRLGETAAQLVKMAHGEKVKIKPPLSKMGRKNLSCFMALQYLRTSDMRSFQNESFSHLCQRILEETLPIQFPDLDPTKYSVKPTDDYIKGLHLETILSCTEYAKYFHDKYWIFAININDEPFITSDNPVVKLPTKLHPMIPHDGLDSFAMRIVYPISPKMAITMYDKKAFPPFAKWDGKPRYATSETVRQYNLLQLSNCSRQIYSSTDEFEFAVQACAADPALHQEKIDRLIPFHPALEQVVETAISAAHDYKDQTEKDE